MRRSLMNFKFGLTERLSLSAHQAAQPKARVFASLVGCLGWLITHLHESKEKRAAGSREPAALLCATLMQFLLRHLCRQYRAVELREHRAHLFDRARVLHNPNGGYRCFIL